VTEEKGFPKQADMEATFQKQILQRVSPQAGSIVYCRFPAVHRHIPAVYPVCVDENNEQGAKLN
jgi:hypothetical protein